MGPEGAVFVPAILGAGLLVSVGALARDAVHRLRGRRWLDRRAVLDGHETALLVTRGELAARRDTTGRRSRSWHAVLGAGFVALACYLLVGSYGNYVGWTGYVQHIGWIFLGYVLSVAAFGTTGVALVSIAAFWDEPPVWTRPLLSRTPLGRMPQRTRGSEAVHLLLATPTEELPLRQRMAQVIRIDQRAAETARVVAGLWGAATVVTLSLLAFQDYLPRSKDPDTIELAVSGPVQMALLATFAVASLIASRHEAAGSALMVGAAAGLAVISAIQYQAWMAALIMVALGMPAFLHWLAWQRDRHLHHLALLVVASLVTMGVVVRAADHISDITLGPAHPQSQISALPSSEVAWIWAGGTTESSTTVVAQLARPHASVRLVVSRNVDLTQPTWTPPQAATDAGQRVLRFPLDGLDPDTRYHYAVEVDGVLDAARTGTVQTFPVGAASYTVAIGSCARSFSNGAVFDAVAQHQPLLFVQTGDLHYANIEDDDASIFIDAFASALAMPAQSNLYRSTSTAYMWDDHDYGGNDADRTSPSRDAAQLAYRMAVPHYPLGERSSRGAVYQAFTVGRVRYLLTDGRSERDPPIGSESPSMLGPEQLAWFEAELRDAAARETAVVWINGTPWVDAPRAGSDTWAGYAAEREHLSRLIEGLDLDDRMLMVGGDAHMVAFDDGTNSAYGSSDRGIPVFHAGALDRPPGAKGGPYSDGMFPGAGQFGTLRVDDDGGSSIEITATGRTWDGRQVLEHAVRLRTT